MDRRELFAQIIETYERHGWKPARVLVTSGGREELSTQLPADVSLIDSEIDAVWFARPSHALREAWELRLLSEQPYALFEAFEADETEEDREEARQEMEHKMRDYAGL
jgi:hypothetical protein